jgi:hypothetical protein
VGQLLESGYSLSFNDGMCNIRDKMGILLLSAKMMNRSFNIDWKEACLSVNTCVIKEVLIEPILFYGIKDWGISIMLP